MKKLALLLIAPLLFSTGCSGDHESAGEQEVVESAAMDRAEAEAIGRSAQMAQADMGRDASMAPTASDQSSGSQELPEELAENPMIIKTGNLRIKVDSIEVAMAEVRAIAESHGGRIGNISVHGGEHQSKQATLQVKVPSENFDAIVSGLEPVGDMEQVNVSAQDVSEEYLDVSARLKNMEQLEERLLQLLRNNTGDLQELLQVERELARVRTQIEQLQGRLRYLRTRASVSTLTVNLFEPKPLVSTHPGENVIVEAFKQAWRNFVGTIATIIAASGSLIPLLIIIGLAVWVLRLIWVRRRKRTGEKDMI